MSQPTPGTTYYTRCRRGRVVYRPDWSAHQPWVAYVDGTATRHFVFKEGAAIYFAGHHHMILCTDEPDDAPIL